MDLIKKYLEEQETIDTGWKKAQTDRKDQYGNRIKNVARRLARQGMQAAVKDLKKGPEAGKRQVEEVEELDELNPPTVQKYITRAKFSSNPKRRAMAQKAQSKLQQKPKPMKTEEVELISELKPRTLASYTSKAADQMAHAAIDKSTGAAMGTMGRMSDMPDLAKQGTDKEDKAFKIILKRSKGISSASRRLAKEEVELDENLNNKLSSLNTTVNKIIKSKNSRTSYLKNVASGKSGSLIHPDTAKKLLNKPTNEEVELDEISQELATKAYAKRSGTMSHNDPVARKKEDKAWERIGKRWGKKGQEKADAAADKYNEEVDLVSKYSKLGEAKYPGFRVRTTSGYPNLGPKLPRRGYGYVPQGDTDPRTGLPLGFSNPPKKDEPKEPESQKKPKSS